MIDKRNSDKYNSIQTMKQVKNSKVKKLLEYFKSVFLLNKVSALLDWDLNVNLPVIGTKVRTKDLPEVGVRIRNNPIWP